MSDLDFSRTQYPPQPSLFFPRLRGCMTSEKKQFGTPMLWSPSQIVKVVSACSCILDRSTVLNHRKSLPVLSWTGGIYKWGLTCTFAHVSVRAPIVWPGHPITDAMAPKCDAFAPFRCEVRAFKLLFVFTTLCVTSECVSGDGCCIQDANNDVLFSPGRSGCQRSQSVFPRARGQCARFVWLRRDVCHVCHRCGVNCLRWCCARNAWRGRDECFEWHR